MKRVIVYIDGFNLYFGLKSKGWKRYYWLNLQKLAINLLRNDQQLVGTKYFTSRVSFPPDKNKRSRYLLKPWRPWIIFRFFMAITCQILSNVKSVGILFQNQARK